MRIGRVLFWNPTMAAGGNGMGGVVVSRTYGLPKLKMSSAQPSGVMSCVSSAGYVPSWIQKHLAVSWRIECGLYSWYFTSRPRHVVTRRFATNANAHLPRRQVQVEARITGNAAPVRRNSGFGV